MRGPEKRSTDRISESTGFSASPWAYNGKNFAMSEDGDAVVIQPGPEFKVVGKNSLDEMTLATPVVSSGSLIVRTASKLFRISKAQPQ
jgi:outer membrane protein assembly factor BamB